MIKESQIKLTYEQRKMILELLNYSYTVPQEFQECLFKAIRKYATKQYSDNVIKDMVTKPQSIAQSGFLLSKHDLSLFRGKLAEWLACIEYNALKNSGCVVMTIVNPDPTSKADLLHFIKTGNEFKTVSGPDIKTGGSTYVFKQWKKIVLTRHDIPLVDFDGVLTTEEGIKQLTPKQRLEFDELCREYPKKKPVPSFWTKTDELKIREEYFQEILDDFPLQYSNETYEQLKKGLQMQFLKQESSDWSYFNKKCKEIFGNSNQEKSLRVDAASNHQTSSNSISKAIKVLSKIGHTALRGAEIYKAVKPAKISKTQKLASSVKRGITFIKENKKIAVTIVAIPVGVMIAGKKIIGSHKGNSSIKLLDDFTSVVNKGCKQGRSILNRKSPRLHSVKGYIRKNGTVVKSYFRGRN